MGIDPSTMVSLVDERGELLTLLRRALDSAPPQSLWRAEEGD
jgi:hypothetical protein